MTFLVERHVALSAYNTMALAATADFFAVALDQYDIVQAMQYARAGNLPVCVLGGGSNVIFVGDYAGLVLLVRTRGIRILEETAHDILLEVEAGECWDDFLQYCLQQKWYGLENLAIIPGTVGAAPIQNIGAYGQEVADCIEAVRVIHFADLAVEELSKERCQFAYRDSVFKQQLHNQCLITAVRFRLAKTFTPELSYQALAESFAGSASVTAEEIRNRVISIREAKLPRPEILPNCGSFFKNPFVEPDNLNELLGIYPDMPVYRQANGLVKVSAGWLIEKAGWKGKRLGNAGVYGKQALVLVNYGVASYAELEALINAIKTDIYQRFAIVLEQEPVLIGAS